MDLGPTITLAVRTQLGLARILFELATADMYFSVMPLGDDLYDITCRADRAPTLIAAVKALPKHYRS